MSDPDTSAEAVDAFRAVVIAEEFGVGLNVAARWADEVEAEKGRAAARHC